MATLDVTSSPTNASVSINGKSIGKTTLRNYKISPGNYSLLVTKSGYKSYQQFFQITSKTLTKGLHATLQKEVTVTIKRPKDDDEDEDDEPIRLNVDPSKAGHIGKGNTLTDEELSKIPMNQRPTAKGFFGKDILAPQLTEEEKRPFGERNVKTGFTAIFGALGLGALTSGILSFLTGAGISTGGGIIAGITTGKVVSAIAGFDGIMVWMASDNILSGTAFTLRKLREAIKVGAVSAREARKELERVQEWITRATAFVKDSATINPIILPFKNILLLNADKAQKDYDLEKILIEAAIKKVRADEREDREKREKKEDRAGEKIENKEEGIEKTQRAIAFERKVDKIEEQIYVLSDLEDPSDEKIQEKRLLRRKISEMRDDFRENERQIKIKELLDDIRKLKGGK